MKYLATLLIVLTFFNTNVKAQSTSQIKGTSTLIIHLNGLESDDGTVIVGIYNEETAWLNKVYKAVNTEIIDGKASVSIDSLPQGTYAISCYHDQNGNKELDTKYFGIPSEPYACSNGAVGRFGPPAWDDAKLSLTENQTKTSIQF